MPRFKWNDRKNGRLLNKYIDYICDEFPTIAKDIVKQGIGDLGYWFGDEEHGGNSVKDATCGCLIGTSALCAMKRYPKTAVDLEAYQNDSADAPMVLYQFIVEKTKRDVSKYADPNDFYAGSDERDPLLQMIREAGEVAANEAVPQDANGNVIGDFASRDRQVRDHFEDRIRRNLNLPYPKQKTKHAQA